VPDGVNELFVILVGGGGKGGSGTTSRGGFGGQSGEVLSRKVSVLPGQQIMVTIGVGGTVYNGGASSFGELITASGGAGAGTSITDVPGMAGGSGLGQSGTFKQTLGAGAAGNEFGGGGSGGYGAGAAGGNGASGGCWVFW
jgi:hypothetical protein